ncbi:hypothetical protein CHS0354_021990, partial [Potamilus streckersoni]
MVKERVLELIDNLVRDVKQQTELIYNEELAKKANDIDHCYSLVEEVQTSTQRIDSVIQNGNKTQKFLTEYQEQRRMITIRDQIFNKYGKLEFKHIKFTMCDNLKTLLSLRSSELGTVEPEDKIETIPGFHRNPDDGKHLKINRCPDLWHPGDVCVFSDDKIAVSLPNKKIQFLTCVPNRKLQFTEGS